MSSLPSNGRRLHNIEPDARLLLHAIAGRSPGCLEAAGAPLNLETAAGKPTGRASSPLYPRTAVREFRPGDVGFESSNGKILAGESCDKRRPVKGLSALHEDFGGGFRCDGFGEGGEDFFMLFRGHRNVFARRG